MKPRSEELLAGASEWLATAEAALRSGFPGGAAAEAYYAVLYAARAALSEDDRYAKTHSGTWDLFHRLFVATGRFDSALYVEARRIERLRLDAHYEARAVPAEDARRAVRAVERFVAEIERTLSPEQPQ